MIKKVGAHYELRTKNGKKLLGKHPSKESAERQEMAIQLSEARAKGADIPEPKRR